MKKYITFILFISAITLTACAQQTPKAETAKTSNNEIIQALQSGGHIVYFRHAETEKDYADQVDAVMGDCSTQRSLSEKGWKDAKAIGKAFEEFAIPIQKVYSSQYCRAWQTADLAFGSYDKKADLNFIPAEEFTDEQMEQMRKSVWPYVTKVPKEGKNIIIVGHDDLFEAASGIYPEPQGIGYVLKPDGENFEIIGNVLPNQWTKL